MVLFTKPVLAIVKAAIAELYTHTTLENLLEMYDFSPPIHGDLSNKLKKVSAYLDNQNWSNPEVTKKLIDLLTHVYTENNHLIGLGKEGMTSNPIYHMTKLHETLENHEIKWDGKAYIAPSFATTHQNALNSLALKDLTQIHSAFSEYKALSVIGNGGCGKVYKVQDPQGNSYALKILSPEKLTAEKVSRFKNEILFSLKISHPNIIQVQDMGFLHIEKKKCPFYVMPLYHSSFRSIIGEKENFQLKLKLYLTLLDGVMHAHSKECWHRDIKPENILYSERENALILTDFGIAHINEEYIVDDVNTKMGDRLANFQYASPEQRITGGRVDARSDIYSLGLILNELFTGTIPWGANHKTIADADPNFADLDPYVESMLQHDSTKRMNRLNELSEKLKEKIQ